MAYQSLKTIGAKVVLRQLAKKGVSSVIGFLGGVVGGAVTAAITINDIAKPLEGCSKSHFSYIRNEVEKVVLRPLILERFLEPKSSQDPEKVVSKSF